jgi:hypothetical protein
MDRRRKEPASPSKRSYKKDNNYNRSPSRTPNNRTNSGAPVDPYIYELLRKLKRRKIKYQRIIQRCQSLDNNEDQVIHVSDLEDVLVDYLGIDNVSRREIDRLSRILRPRKGSFADGSINYMDLEQMFSKAEENMDEGMFQAPDYRENADWFDSDNFGGHFKKGSVGDLFENNSCPAEKSNFRSLILCLEEYERMTGMKAKMTEDGLTVAIGPELRANINFFRV